jgi:hypothetical protein
MTVAALLSQLSPSQASKLETINELMERMTFSHMETSMFFDNLDSQCR